MEQLVQRLANLETYDRKTIRYSQMANQNMW